MRLVDRLGRHRRVSSALASADDAELSALVEAGSARGARGIGGSSAVVEVGGATVFVKRIPLTDLERDDRTTGNPFGLPAFCHYGVGSPGFGVWRELAANVMTTDWVLTGQSHAFPLLHHWRVLPGAPAPAAEHADARAATVFWGGSSAVHERLEGLARASESVVLFLEHIPSTVADWLATEVAHDEHAALAAAELLECELLDGVRTMNTRGLLHFDAHFDNVLTDGHRLYFADLGLATSTRFTLSPDEARFVERNRTHDRGYVAARLVNWLVSTFGGLDDPADALERNRRVRLCALGRYPPAMPGPAVAIVRRHAAVAAVVDEFYAELFTGRRDVPYPSSAVDRALGP